MTEDRRSEQSTSLDEHQAELEVVTAPVRPDPAESARLSGAAPVDAVAILSVDPHSGSARLVFVSEGLATILGRRPAELVGEGPSALFAPDGLKRFREAASDLGLSVTPSRSPQPSETDQAAPADPLSMPRQQRRASDRVGARPSRSSSAQGSGSPFSTGQGAGRVDARPWLDSTNILGTPDAPLEAGLALGTTASPVADVPQIDLSGIPGASPSTDDPIVGQVPVAPSMPVPDRQPTADSSIQSTRSGFDGPVPLVAGERRVHTAIQQLVSPRGRSVPMHVTYTTVPSGDPESASIVLEFRDLEQPSAERLLADQTAVIGSLSRGHELGRLCHQVASQLERDLDDGSRCWMSITDPNGNLEPVLAGDLPFDTVSHIVAELAALGPANARRLVSVDILSGSASALLRGRGVRTLWYLPLLNQTEDGEKVSGAVVVVTPRERPDRAAVRSLDNLISVMQVAIEQATAKVSISHQTLHDPLTGLPNRALLVDRLNQAMARLDRDGIALSVLLVDIDQFKSVNDSHGAAVGDKVLLQVAARLLGVLRLGDTVGRLSNDQFLVMCASGRGELDPAVVGRRILRSLAKPLSVGTGTDLRITASVGLVVVDEPGPTPEAVISNAESALAVATSKGRGCMAFYKADLQRHSVQRHQTEQALHKAIAQDEFLVVYQPLVEIKTGFMVGAEALVRWDRPGHGVLGAAEFIPLAEESDLIVDLGRWVLDRVCKDLRQWPRSRGRSPMVTVNLAARQVVSDSLVPMVQELLERHEVPTARVGFEITESMEIQKAEQAVVNLTQLKEMGCRIAIDDFGIGYATLDYIRRFSMADALKIDRSFIAGMGDSQEDAAIVNASIALASSLGLQVVAEGVETPEQLRTLRDLGARYAQGFGLARPMPFDAVLDRWRHAQLYQPAWD